MKKCPALPIPKAPRSTDDMRPADDPIPRSFRAALDEMYGDRAERVVLYGSRAR
jgi:hypothetical protein